MVEITNTTEVGNEQSSETASNESSEEFSYLPTIYNTPIYRLEIRYFRLIQGQVNKLITENRDLLVASLKALNALPDKTTEIEATIARMSNILKRIDNQDLSQNDVAAITEKTDIISELTDLYEEFATLLDNGVSENDVAVLEEHLDKIDLDGFNKRLDASLKDTSNKITKVANNFFSKLNEEERRKYAELINWYEGFKQQKSDLDKYNEAVLLLRYLLIHRF